MVLFFLLLSGTTKRVVRKERKPNLEQKPHRFHLKRLRGKEFGLLELTFLSNLVYRPSGLGKDSQKSHWRPQISRSNTN